MLRVLVKVGDAVAAGQGLLELETDKATVEVPSPSAGGGGQGRRPRSRGRPVGGGARGSAGRCHRPRRRRQAPPCHRRHAGCSAGGGGRSPAGACRLGRPAAEGAGTGAVGAAASDVPAAPSVHRMARELGLDIADVPGSGKGGRMRQDDVRAHAKNVGHHRQGGRAGRRPGGRRVRPRAGTGLHEVRRHGTQGDARHPAQTTEHHGGQLAHHPARHAVREGGHHGARAHVGKRVEAAGTSSP